MKRLHLLQEMMKRESSDPYYDIIDDFGLIIASFQSQYGIRLSRELDTMKFDEFKDLLAGIDPKTPLGRIVSIRAENDPEILKHFGHEEKRIRREWRLRSAKKIPAEDAASFYEDMKQTFIRMAGGSD